MKDWLSMFVRFIGVFIVAFPLAMGVMWMKAELLASGVHNGLATFLSVGAMFVLVGAGCATGFALSMRNR